MNRKETGDYMMRMDTKAVKLLWDGYSESQIQGFAAKLDPDLLGKMAVAGTDISKVINMLESAMPLGDSAVEPGLDFCMSQSSNGLYRYSQPVFAVPYGARGEQRLYRCASTEKCPMLMPKKKDEVPMCGVYSNLT